MYKVWDLYGPRGHFALLSEARAYVARQLLSGAKSLIIYDQLGGIVKPLMKKGA